MELYNFRGTLEVSRLLALVHSKYGNFIVASYAQFVLLSARCIRVIIIETDEEEPPRLSRKRGQDCRNGNDAHWTER
jgi:metal-responsive CopG/Arc/MetJ family transcriptional regulator